MSHIICLSLQTSSSSNIVSCDGTGDTFHDPTGVGNEYSPPDLKIVKIDRVVVALHLRIATQKMLHSTLRRGN